MTDNLPEYTELESLDGVFTLPPGLVESDELRHMWEVIVSRMRKEAVHLPMNTVQMLLIERIATNYVILREKENMPLGHSQGFAHATVQKDFNTFWLTMTKEFNALLGRTDTAVRRQAMGEVRDILLSVLEEVPVSGLSRAELQKKIVLKFQEAGL